MSIFFYHFNNLIFNSDYDQPFQFLKIVFLSHYTIIAILILSFVYLLRKEFWTIDDTKKWFSLCLMYVGWIVPLTISVLIVGFSSDLLFWWTGRIVSENELFKAYLLTSGVFIFSFAFIIYITWNRFKFWKLSLPDRYWLLKWLLIALLAQWLVFSFFKRFWDEILNYWSILMYSEINPEIFTYWDVYFMLLSLCFLYFLSLLSGILAINRKSISLWLLSLLFIWVSFTYLNPWQAKISANHSSNEVQALCGSDLSPTINNSKCLHRLWSKYWVIINSKDDIQYSKYSVLNGTWFVQSVVIPDVVPYSNYLPIWAQAGWINASIKTQVDQNDPDRHIKYYVKLDNNIENKLLSIIDSSKDITLIEHAHYWLFSYYQKNLEHEKAIKTLSDLIVNDYWSVIQKMIAVVILNNHVKHNSNPDYVDYLLNNWNENYQSWRISGLKDALIMSKSNISNTFEYLSEKRQWFHWEMYQNAKQNNVYKNAVKSYKEDHENKWTINGKIIINDKALVNTKIWLLTNRNNCLGFHKDKWWTKESLSKIEKTQCWNIINSYWGVWEIHIVNTVKTDNEWNFEFNNIGQWVYHIIVADLHKQKNELVWTMLKAQKSPWWIRINTEDNNIDLWEIVLKTHDSNQIMSEINNERNVSKQLYLEKSCDTRSKKTNLVNKLADMVCNSSEECRILFVTRYRSKTGDRENQQVITEFCNNKNSDCEKVKKMDYDIKEMRKQLEENKGNDKSCLKKLSDEMWIDIDTLSYEVWYSYFYRRWLPYLQDLSKF